MSGPAGTAPPDTAIECGTCYGYGQVRDCHHSGNCPCGGIECRDCDGTGVVRCCLCGGDAVAEPNDEPLCQGCRDAR